MAIRDRRRRRLGEIAADAELGPFTVVHADVRIGAGTRVGAHVVIHPGTLIGAGCEIQDGAVLGKPPKLAKHSDAPQRAAGRCASATAR